MGGKGIKMKKKKNTSRLKNSLSLTTPRNKGICETYVSVVDGLQN